MEEDLKRSIVNSLDGNNIEIFPYLPYLPYLLQDLYEFGASPKHISDLIEKNVASKENPKRVIDLGCGKGIISIKLAEKFEYTILGIDAVKEFVEVATASAIENQVSNLVKFEQGDIRKAIKELKSFDIAILGAIGGTLGNIELTLRKVSKIIKSKGYIILDEAFTKTNNYNNTDYISESKFEKIVNELNLKIIDEVKPNKEEFEKLNRHILNMINLRTVELIKKHPKKKLIFIEYFENQLKETNVLENQVERKTILLRKK